MLIVINIRTKCNDNTVAEIGVCSASAQLLLEDTGVSFFCLKLPSSFYSELLRFWTKICWGTTFVVERGRLHLPLVCGEASSDLRPPTPTLHIGWCVDRNNTCSKTNCSSTLRLLACTLFDGCLCYAAVPHHVNTHLLTHSHNWLHPLPLTPSWRWTCCQRRLRVVGDDGGCLHLVFKPRYPSCSCWNYGCSWSCKKKTKKNTFSYTFLAVMCLLHLCK